MASWRTNDKTYFSDKSLNCVKESFLNTVIPVGELFIFAEILFTETLIYQILKYDIMID